MSMRRPEPSVRSLRGLPNILLPNHMETASPFTQSPSASLSPEEEQ
ncbi:hypothetical protein HMPREF1550_02116 [Actinomyces sp. oral taxon 877 str. F0543]|nr:hypothetical protein HMPREF1550_02116 [Actinomyces sp. oral taxon 877 str. F0543]